MHASDWMTTWWRLTLNLLSTRSWSFFARSPEKKWVHDNVIFRSVYNGQLRLCMSYLLCDWIEQVTYYSLIRSGLTYRKLCSNKFTWCFHKRKYYIWCLWCYSECISTSGKLEKYVCPRWESNLRPLEYILAQSSAN